MSRTVNGEFMWDAEDKEMFVRMLWKVADFCGVEVLTYCVLSNHFHVLVKIPDRCRIDVSDEEILRRFKVLHGERHKYDEISHSGLERVFHAKGQEREYWRARLLRQMHDVSEFMKQLKQRFSIWYNRTHNRFGTLWADRFKSVIVEGKGNPLLAVALYIDLNPVRAGIVEDPRRYVFCGVGDWVWRKNKMPERFERLMKCAGLSGNRETPGECYVRWVTEVSAWLADRTANEVREFGENPLPNTLFMQVGRNQQPSLKTGRAVGSSRFVQMFIDQYPQAYRMGASPKVHPLKPMWGFDFSYGGGRGAPREHP